MPEVAEPVSVSAQSTVTGRPLGADSVTLKFSAGFSPGSPSATFGLSMDSVGAASSSSMVPLPSRVSASFGSEALTAPDSRRATVSSSSYEASPVTATAMVLLVSPGAKVSVPPDSLA